MSHSWISERPLNVHTFRGDRLQGTVPQVAAFKNRAEGIYVSYESRISIAEEVVGNQRVWVVDIEPSSPCRTEYLEG